MDGAAATAAGGRRQARRQLSAGQPGAQLRSLTLGPALCVALAAGALARAVVEDHVVGHHLCDCSVQRLKLGVIHCAHAHQLKQRHVVDAARGARRVRGQRLQRGAQRRHQLGLHRVADGGRLLERGREVKGREAGVHVPYESAQHFLRPQQASQVQRLQLIRAARRRGSQHGVCGHGCSRVPAAAGRRSSRVGACAAGRDSELPRRHLCEGTEGGMFRWQAGLQPWPARGRGMQGRGSTRS